jgi:flavin-dependent dehydrogenase
VSDAPPPEVEVAVLGGGPAGAAAARLLASWGHTVLLIDRGSSRPALAESLPPSCDRLLETIGVRELVDGAGFVRSTGNTVWWGDEPLSVEYFPDARLGHQVLRSRFDAVLRQAAADAGALVRHPSAVLGVTTEGGAQVATLEERAERHDVRATWVLDGTGRGGMLSRGGRRRVDAGVRTVALAGVWERDDGWPVPDDTQTLVESVEHGWGWSVPVSERRRFFTVMLDPRHSGLAPGPDALRHYNDEMQRLPALSGLLAGARQVGASWACDASPYSSDPVVGDRALLMGDAASFIDPLSSFGVKKALASGWMAAVVTHTALTRPELRGPAVELFARRERAYVAAATRELASLAARARGGAGAGFWTARAALVNDEVDDQSVDALRADPAVRAAFEVLRTRERAAVRLMSASRIEPRPIIRDHAVSLEPHLICDAFPDGLRFLRSVDVLAVTRIGAGEHDVGRMYERYVVEVGPAALPDFLGVLSVLLGKGICEFA